MNIDFLPHSEDGVAWMRTVRSLAESRGFGWAFWTYYLSPKAVTTAGSAGLRLRQWDCSEERAAVIGKPAVRAGDNESMCPPRVAVGRRLAARTAVDAQMFASARSFHGGSGACNDRRPAYLQARLGKGASF